MIAHQCFNFPRKLLNLLLRAGLRHPLVYRVGEPIERFANVRTSQSADQVGTRRR
jgi:hypothetical protein